MTGPVRRLGALGVCLALVGGMSAVAGAVLVTTDSSHPATAAGDALPQGATPAAPTTAVPNGTTVTVSFPQAATTTGHVGLSLYRVTRYPQAGGAGTTVASCMPPLGGTVTCTDSSVPDGSWVYADTPTYATNWVGTESTKSAAVTVDTTAPTGSLTYTNGYSGSTAVAISFTAADGGSGVDTTSGILQRRSATLAGGACGTFGSFAQVGATGLRSPYTDAALSTGTCAQYQYLVPDYAGNPAGITSASVVKVDAAAPAGSITYATGFRTTTSVAVTFSATDAISGVSTATGVLQRASAALVGGACGAYGSFVQVGATGLSSPYTDAALSTATCFLYQYVVSSLAGVSGTLSSASVVAVDTGTPPAPTLSFSGGVNVSATGATVYYRSTATSGSFVVTASSSAASGITGYTFPTLGAGWSVTGTGASRTYAWATGSPTTTGGGHTVTATSGTAATSPASAAFSLTSDTTVPTGGSVTYTAGMNLTGTLALTLVQGTDAASGIATTSGVLLRASAPMANGTCGAYGSYAVLGTNPALTTSDTTMVLRNCYKYEYQVSDGAGNTATSVSATVVRRGGQLANTSGATATAVSSLVLPSAQSAGDTLVFQMDDNGATAITGVTGAGATWTKLTEHSQPGGLHTGIWYGTAVTTTNTTAVTVSWTGAARTVAVAELTEWTGLVATVDKAATGTASGTTVATGVTVATTLATAAAPDLVIVGAFAAGGSAALPVPAPVGIGTATALSGAGQAAPYKGFAAYGIATANVTAGITWPALSGLWDATVVSINF